MSARPYERTGLLETQGGDKLRAMGLPRHTILSGDAWTLASVLPGRAGERAIAKIGAEKLRNFRQWSELMGEYDFIISGDPTQADHEFAADALALAGGRVLAAFIHDVGDRPRRGAVLSALRPGRSGGRERRTARLHRREPAHPAGPLCPRRRAAEAEAARPGRHLGFAPIHLIHHG